MSSTFTVRTYSWVRHGSEPAVECRRWRGSWGIADDPRVRMHVWCGDAADQGGAPEGKPEGKWLGSSSAVSRTRMRRPARRVPPNRLENIGGGDWRDRQSATVGSRPGCPPGFRAIRGDGGGVGDAGVSDADGGDAVSTVMATGGSRPADRGRQIEAGRSRPADRGRQIKAGRSGPADQGGQIEAGGEGRVDLFPGRGPAGVSACVSTARTPP
jgi:hypothetical protein